MTQEIPNDILHFLATFGTGSPLHGLLIIGLTFGFVGGLFDVYVYYRHQVLSLNSEGLIQSSTITVFCESLENERVYLKPLTRTPETIS
jgi:disulfide bond formation protein DsbB